MLRFVLNKIKNKKWLNICLLTGISLLAAVFACHPMLEMGSANKLLQTEFSEYAKDNEEYPAVIFKDGSYDTAEYGSTESIYSSLEAYEAKWLEYVKVDAVAVERYLKLAGSSTSSSLGNKSRMTSVACLYDLKNHVEVVDGVWPDECECEPGEYACVMSDSVMDAVGLVVGEKLEFTYQLDNDGIPMKLVIAGVIRENSSSDNYWHMRLADMDKQVFVTEPVLDKLITGYNFKSVAFQEYLMMDYTMINSENASQYLDYLIQYTKADKSLSINAISILKEFENQRRTVQTILWVLELPCVVLLILFIYMVSSQILNAEAGEIAVLRSRGVTRRQTVNLYFLQSLVMSAAGLVIGILLGIAMCKAAASTDSFLKFTSKDVSMYTFTWKTIPYGVVACLVAILFMTMPVWKKSRITIVEQKSDSTLFRSKPFWEKIFLDLILLAVSIYLLYNYNKQSQNMALNVISGEGLDPVVFLDASLFIFACGLVLLRLTRYLVIWINHIGKKHWKAPSYASFLQISRTFSKQGFISVFLVMTIAIGIFQANMARTVNENNEERIRYNIGADVRMDERWRRYVRMMGSDMAQWIFVEPDFGRYSELVDAGLCESVTRVIEDMNTDVSLGGSTVEDCQLMGIHTKEFGETARLAEGLNDTHWFYALNELAAEPDSVIISRNLAEKYSVEVGNMITYTRYNPAAPAEQIATVGAQVVAIIDAFPGYEIYKYGYDEDGNATLEENYLVVGNYAQIVSQFDVLPYGVWMRLADGVDSGQIYKFMKDNYIGIEKWSAVDSEISKSRSSALIQITNGMFTMSFIISILICVTGFLIYWIMSIRNREMLFGIYRAMGMRMSGIRKMLINEQIFGSLLPVIAGGGAGMLSTLLFARLIALVYLPEEHNIAVRIYMDMSDVIRILVIVLAAVIVCFIVIRRILKNMKIAQALKLGED